MNERESDPTGAFRGGSAGLDGGERGAHDEPPAGDPAGVDGAERDVITSGTAATSEVADRDAQTDAERQGDGTPRPR